MDFEQFALNMYPFWILGISVIGAVLMTDKKNLLRIRKAPLIKWMKFLILITAIRFSLYELFSNSHAFNAARNASFLPIGVAFTVFWEDAVHGLPLLILKKLIGVNKLVKPLHWLLTLVVMVEFGMGHMYQGVLPALVLSFYVPYSVKMGEKHGFGTVMIAHMLYDLSSMAFIKFIAGL
jgi:hypothetical protein